MQAPFPAIVLAAEVTTHPKLCPEFDEAGIPWQRAGLRLDHLERTLDVLPEVPLLVGGWGDRTLRLAAKHADTIGLTGAPMVDEQPYLASAAAFEERVRFVREALSGRDAELNVLVQRAVLTDHREQALEKFQPYSPNLTPEELGEVPTLLIGTAEQIADQLRGHSERLGLTYFTILEQDLHAFGPVLELLR